MGFNGGTALFIPPQHQLLYGVLLFRVQWKVLSKLIFQIAIRKNSSSDPLLDSYFSFRTNSNRDVWLAFSQESGLQLQSKLNDLNCIVLTPVHQVAKFNNWYLIEFHFQPVQSDLTIHSIFFHNISNESRTLGQIVVSEYEFFQSLSLFARVENLHCEVTWDLETLDSYPITTCSFTLSWSIPSSSNNHLKIRYFNIYLNNEWIGRSFSTFFIIRSIQFNSSLVFTIQPVSICYTFNEDLSQCSSIHLLPRNF